MIDASVVTSLLEPGVVLLPNCSSMTVTVVRKVLTRVVDVVIVVADAI
jgi:hypothetical protein